MRVGPKFTYDSKKLPSILAAIERAKGSLGQVADLNAIPRATFYEWIRLGDIDRNNNLETDFAQLAYKIRTKQGEVICDLINTGLEDEKKSRFIMWFLGKVCREDFGVEGIELLELRNIFKVILPLIGKGSIEHGEQMDSKDAP